MRRLILALLLILPAAALAQLTERIEVNVVNVDVTVTDRHGQPVHGLTRDDFEILEDGLPQTVTNFYVVENAKQHGAAEASAEERFRRKVLVVIDNFHSTKARRDLALARLEQFVNDRFGGGEYDWSIAVVDRAAHLILPLTSDKATIHNAIAAVRKLGTKGGTETLFPIADRDRLLGEVAEATRFTISPDLANETTSACNPTTAFAQFANAAEQQMNMRDTASAILELERALANDTGKKIILLLTGELGLSDLAGATCTRAVFDFRREIIDARDLLIREANASNVNVYVVNTEGLHVPGWDRWADVDTSTMYWLAAETGGRFIPGNSVDEALKMFDSTSSNFYSLGYRPTHGDDGRYHRIKVRIRKSGYRLQYRDSYSSAPPQAQLERALQSRLAVSTIRSAFPISLFTGEAHRRDRGVLIPVTVTIPGNAIHYLPNATGAFGRFDVYLSIFRSNDRNVMVRRFTQEVTAGSDPIRYTIPLLLGKQPYKIVIAVRDQLSDAVGVATQTVDF